MTSPSAYSLAALQNYLAQGANTPTAELVDRVKDETGIVPSHLAPLQDNAMTTNSIIGIRPVETVATGLIEAGHPTKDFHIKGKSANKSPFSLAWAEGSLSREHLARWAENHYHYVGPFADYLAYIYARTPDHMTDAKDFLLANMYEEEIGGDRHTDLLIRFAEACGTTRARVVDQENMSPTTRALQSWCYAVAMREDPVVAVAGLVVGLESQVPSIYRKQTPTLRDKYGFSDEEVEFFDLHIVSDEIHGERGYQIVLEHATTVEMQQRCIKICEVGAQMRLLYTTALYNDYVAPELALAA